MGVERLEKRESRAAFVAYAGIDRALRRDGTEASRNLPAAKSFAAPCPAAARRRRAMACAWRRECARDAGSIAAPAILIPLIKTSRAIFVRCGSIAARQDTRHVETARLDDPVPLGTR